MFGRYEIMLWAPNQKTHAVCPHDKATSMYAVSHKDVTED